MDTRDASYAVKIVAERRATDELFAASAVLGGASTVWDVITRLGDAPREGAWSEVDEQNLGAAMLEAEHARIVTAGAALREYVAELVASLTADAHFPPHPVGPHTQMRAVGSKRMLEPPAPSAAPTAADWLAVGIQYYAALAGRHPYARLDRPLWAGACVIDNTTRGLDEGLALLDAPIAPPSAHDASVTEAEDELALALVALRVGTRAELIDLCERAR